MPDFLVVTYDPVSAGKVFQHTEEKETTHEQVNVPPTVPVMTEPTIYYQPTTTVPISFTIPPSASPPTVTHSVQVSPKHRTYLVRPTSTDPGIRTENRRRRRTYKRVNSRNWSFLLPIIRYWRSQEGNPSKRELGESSASLPKILPVTGEPIHHTIPLLATRIARHEDRFNDIVNMAVESKVEQMKTEFSESLEFIAALCSANVAIRDVLTSFDHELEQICAHNSSLRRAIRESHAREQTRDQIIETLTTKITELQRRMDEVSGKP
ncbi:hypothetical protein CTI12_AA619420 [Artemisia annua]|uniref:Uncharacterized protein n=1 Tax=Artemisia annua TaxID=35608 RepID=A0A2U1KCF7_ARTAN|nr:hypothetical protein CTI12_AA619420 [Artemisia annua]